MLNYPRERKKLNLITFDHPWNIQCEKNGYITSLKLQYKPEELIKQEIGQLITPVILIQFFEFYKRSFLLIGRSLFSFKKKSTLVRKKKNKKEKNSVINIRNGMWEGKGGKIQDLKKVS